MSELKKTKKMKVVQLNKYIPKQLSNPTATPKIAHSTKICPVNSPLSTETDLVGTSVDQQD